MVIDLRADHAIPNDLIAMLTLDPTNDFLLPEKRNDLLDIRECLHFLNQALIIISPS